MRDTHQTGKGSWAFAAVVGIAIGAITSVALASHDRETTTTLESSADVINLGETVTLSGAVTWPNTNSNTDEPVDDGAVTLSVGDENCSTASLQPIGTTETFDSDSGSDFLFDHVPSAGTHGYLAEFSGATHGQGGLQVKYEESASDCVLVTVNNNVSSDSGRAAPAVANDYINNVLEQGDRTACQSLLGKSWRGQIISEVAHTYNPKPFVEDDVIDTIRDKCGL